MHDLTREQVEALLASVRRQIRYLGRLRDRMNQRGFPPDDPLYVAATGAFNAVHALSVEVHCLTCPAGTAGRRSCHEDSLFSVTPSKRPDRPSAAFG